MQAEARAGQPTVHLPKKDRRSTDPAHPRPLEGDPTRRRLTPQECRIALLIAEGLSDVVIARRLSISPGTVQTYSRRIQGRLSLTSRSQIADWTRARLAHREHSLLRRLDDPSTTGVTQVRTTVPPAKR